MMAPTDALPLVHSTPKHKVLISRRQLKILGSASVCLVLIVFVLSTYTRPIYSQRIPLSSSGLQAQSADNTSELYSPDPSRSLSSLGPKADQVYKLGSLSPVYYRASLEAFIDEAFPFHLRSHLRRQLHEYLEDSSTSLPERPKVIWQTYSTYPETPEVHSWQQENPDYDYRFLNNEDVEIWVERNFKGSPIEKMWNVLPHIILKSDLLRYLLLYIEGGVYSDIDTLCLKPIDIWGRDPDIRGQFRGDDLPAAILGVEADVGERWDWYDWWSRPLQISQWTLAFSPGHPILLDAIERIYRRTMELERAPVEPIGELSEEKILTLVLEWTGPGVFTDATIRFLQIQDGLQWIDLRQLEKPLRIGAITLLPVTGFSPGVGNFGAQSITHPQAMVEHKFKGSWKPKEKSF